MYRRYINKFILTISTVTYVAWSECVCVCCSQLRAVLKRLNRSRCYLECRLDGPTEPCIIICVCVLLSFKFLLCIVCVRVCMIYYVLLYYLYYYLLLLYYYAAFNAPCVGHKDDESQAVGVRTPGPKGYFGGISWPVEKCHDQLSIKLRVACLVT